MSPVLYPKVLHEIDEPRWMDGLQNQIINMQMEKGIFQFLLN